jgi:hypothetical protein
MNKVTISILVLFFGIIALAAENYTQRTTISLNRDDYEPVCEGTECPGGCCPERKWYCCPDNIYCAATAADCPM